nr:MAG TPA: hypothetical protein [Caudoviricetes sp.]
MISYSMTHTCFHSFLVVQIIVKIQIKVKPDGWSACHW